MHFSFCSCPAEFQSALAVVRSATLALSLLGAVARPAVAAPGDPSGPLRTVAQGGVNDHDPYFQDFSRPQGMTALTNGNLVVGWRARDFASATPTSPDGAGYGSFLRVYGA